MDIVSLYFELIELPLAEQNARMEALSDLDPEQRDELRNMLDAGTELLSGSQLIAKHMQAGPAVDYQRYIGQVVMGFTITEILSEAGGMGLVFLAQQELYSPDSKELKVHRAAVKVLRYERMNAEQQQQFFYREAASLMELDQPNICKIYGISQILDQACIVMDFIDGVALDDWLAEHRIEQDKVLALFVVLLKAMCYAHNKHIYHGDLKPQNILVDGQGQLTLIDLGLAKQFDPHDKDDFTQHYIQAFSQYWSAPEQRQGKWNKSQSDVYSLGAILAFMLSGTTPSRDDLNTINDRELRAIIAKSLSPDPAQRYRDANEFLAVIQRFRQGFAIKEYSNSWLYRAQKGLTRRPLINASIALSLSLLIGTSVATWRHNQVLMAEQTSSQQVMAQLEQMLRDNFPHLHHRFEQPPVEQLYVQGAKRWLGQQQNLTKQARMQTGLLFIQGLFIDYSENVDLVFDILEALEVATELDMQNEQQLQLQYYWMLAHTFNAFKGIETTYGDDNFSFYNYRNDPSLIPDSNPAAPLAKQLIASLNSQQQLNPLQLHAIIAALKVPMPFDIELRRLQYQALFAQASPYLLEAHALNTAQRLDLLAFIYLGSAESPFFDQSRAVNNLDHHFELRQQMRSILPALTDMLGVESLSIQDYYRLQLAITAIDPTQSPAQLQALISPQLNELLSQTQLVDSAQINTIELQFNPFSEASYDHNKDIVRDNLAEFRRRYGSEYGDMMTHLSLLQKQSLRLGSPVIINYLDNYLQSQAMRVRRLDWKHDSAYQGLDLAIIQHDWDKVQQLLSELETDFELYFKLLEDNGLEAYGIRQLHRHAWTPAINNDWKSAEQQIAQSKLSAREQKIYLAILSLNLGKVNDTLILLPKPSDLPQTLSFEFDQGFYQLNELIYFYGKHVEPKEAIEQLEARIANNKEYRNIFNAAQALYLCDLLLDVGEDQRARQMFTELQDQQKAFAFRDDWQQLWGKLSNQL
ncbi:serine/threonine protein kinase [Vibrio hippocampi]|uniref:Serine/threonine-protein kinase PknD n=1 Tax=Vibrio hippocampi TaxID=654686 RepID=A0ABN8DLG6_9VIBR|nr:serine/threonine-protein kinase [Vibrio hippocampi]CAH0526225.1 Serine/threonine-protein kinase PknD [Vibrio hippocampi]